MRSTRSDGIRNLPGPAGGGRPLTQAPRLKGAHARAAAPRQPAGIGTSMLPTPELPLYPDLPYGWPSEAP